MGRVAADQREQQHWLTSCHQAFKNKTSEPTTPATLKPCTHIYALTGYIIRYPVQAVCALQSACRESRHTIEGLSGIQTFTFHCQAFGSERRGDGQGNLMERHAGAVCAMGHA